MADEKTPEVDTKNKSIPADKSTVEVSTNDGAAVTPDAVPVRVQEGSLVGDEAIAAAGSIDVTPTVIQEDVPAQTTGVEPPEVQTVRVHEVHVVTDEIITDPHSEHAVQIPDAGRGTLDLPIHALDGPLVEDVFAAASKDAQS